MTAEMEEEKLLCAAQVGSAADFQRLVCGYDAAILGLAMRLTASEREARRLYRKAMLSVYENLAVFSFECPFYIWVYRHVCVASMDYLRQKRLPRPGNIDGALVALTPCERMVLELKHYQQESFESIGQMLGVTEEVARNALVRGIQKLDSRLNEHDSVDPR
jgi:RNA polymerase sigma-70 factor (ECF subfamily)